MKISLIGDKKMKYKIGDKVRVREWNDMVNEYGMSDDGDIPVTLAINFIKEMSTFCGDTFTISEINGDEYSLSGDEDEFIFTNEMLLPVHDEINFTFCGDWQILECDGFKASGHSISAHDWCDLLRYLGHDVEEKEISDEEM